MYTVGSIVNMMFIELKKNGRNSIMKYLVVNSKVTVIVIIENCFKRNASARA